MDNQIDGGKPLHRVFALIRNALTLASGLPESLQAWWKRRHELRRYVLFGGLNTVLTCTIYLACLRFVTYRMAYTVTFVCGILISYLFNAQFVFQKRLQVTKGLQFGLVYVVQYCVGLGLLFILVEVARVSKLFAPILLLFFIVPANFWLNRRVLMGGSVRS